MKRALSYILIIFIAFGCIFLTGCKSLTDKYLEWGDEIRHKRQRADVAEEVGLEPKKHVPVEEEHMIDFQGWGHYYAVYECEGFCPDTESDTGWKQTPITKDFADTCSEYRFPVSKLGFSSIKQHWYESVNGYWYYKEHNSRARTIAVYDAASGRLLVLYDAH